MTEQQQQELGVGAYPQPCGWQHCMLGGLSGVEHSPRTNTPLWEGLARDQHLLGTPGLHMAALA